MKGKAWKLAWPYFGSYKVLSLTLMPRYSWQIIRKVSQSLSLSIVFAVVTMKCQMKFGWDTVLKLRGALSIPNLMLVCRDSYPVYEGPITGSMSRELAKDSEMSTVFIYELDHLIVIWFC